MGDSAGAGGIRSEERSDEAGWRRPAGAPSERSERGQHSPGVGGIRSEERSDEAGWRRPPGAPSERSERGQHSPGAWLYAITAGLDPHRLVGIRGIGGAPVHTVVVGGLSCVVSPVDLDEYGAEPLRRKLNDPAQLEATARSHHEVVAATAQATATVPARLATIYDNQQRVVTLLTQRRADFTALLAQVTGRTEWGVKAYARHQQPPADRGAAGSATSGTAYLLSRRARLHAADNARRAAADAAVAVHAALARIAAAAHHHPPQDTHLTAQPDVMVLNSAYLVDDQRGDRFAAAVADLATDHPGLRLQMTGPWPAYSFTAITEREPPA